LDSSLWNKKLCKSSATFNKETMYPVEPIKSLSDPVLQNSDKKDKVDTGDSASRTWIELRGSKLA
jgi:hypothetical protein